MPQRIGSNQIANTSVIGLKLADNSVRANNIVAGQITGNLIGTGQITGDLISTGQITGNLIGTQAVSSNHIAQLAVTGTNLSPNLSISTARIIETVNVSSIAASGNVNIDMMNASVHIFTPNTTSNVTFNLRANSTTRLDSAISNGQSVTVGIGIFQGSTQYAANIYIDGVLQSQNTEWMGNLLPKYTASISNQIMDMFSITAIKTGSNSYIVLAGNTVFGVGA